MTLLSLWYKNTHKQTNTRTFCIFLSLTVQILRRGKRLKSYRNCFRPVLAKNKIDFYDKTSFTGFKSLAGWLTVQCTGRKKVKKIYLKEKLRVLIALIRMIFKFL